MKFFRKILALVLVLALLPVPAVQAAEDTDALIQQLLGACLNGQENEAEMILTQLEKADPQQGEAWGELLEDWAWIYEDMEIHGDVLPDGLPQDDSLCIVVMGYCLNANGSIRPELLDRLQVAVRSAEKYPNAYILCTGGPTALDRGFTEAGQMAQFLACCGIDESRILVEDASLSTTQNALNSYELLCEKYPQITSLALVTSDYHIYRSCLMFQAVSILHAANYGTRRIDVAANAVCQAESEGGEDLYSQVWGLAVIVGVDMPEIQEERLN